MGKLSQALPTSHLSLHAAPPQLQTGQSTMLFQHAVSWNSGQARLQAALRPTAGIVLVLELTAKLPVRTLRLRHLQQLTAMALT